MTTWRKLIHRKLSLLELAEYLKNVSEACRVVGVSRQHFCDIKQASEEGGIEALREHTRRKPNLRNRAAPEVEAAVCELAVAQPALGQVRAANELRQRGPVAQAPSPSPARRDVSDPAARGLARRNAYIPSRAR